MSGTDIFWMCVIGSITGFAVYQYRKTKKFLNNLEFEYIVKRMFDKHFLPTEGDFHVNSRVDKGLGLCTVEVCEKNTGVCGRYIGPLIDFDDAVEQAIIDYKEKLK